MDNLFKIGITQGDTNGVGYELIFKLFDQPEMLSFCIPVVYGSAKVATYHKKALGTNCTFHVVRYADEAKAGKLNFVNCYDEETKVEFGVASAEAGLAAFNALEKATADLQEHLIDALVTMPVNKNNIQQSGHPFVGHTEYLETKFSEHSDRSLMILMNDSIKVALVTTHLPVSKIAESITADKVELKLRLLQYSLRHDFLIPMPRVAVLALNPHCGDSGLLGKEETNIIKPVVDKLVAEGKHVYGPFPADGFFGNGQYKHFDAVLAMYHDQGLAPFKALAQGNGVNFTAGLNCVRTSPDHGTAYDIAGKGIADTNSFKQALFTAIDIVKNRAFDAEANENPLPQLYQTRTEGKERADK